MSQIDLNKISSDVKRKFNIKDNTFFRTPKNNWEDRIEIEVGDSKQPDFKPQFKLMRWDNEVNFSIRAEEHPSSKVEFEGEKVKYVTPEYEVHQYDKPNASEDGGFEFEWIIPKKPKSNVLRATIETKELDFFYQPALTQEEIDEGNQRPENVIGSYAVYHSTKKNHVLGQKNYKAGKAFHIYRPKVIDAEGKEVWCELNINEQKKELTVTIPQEFLETAIYPIIVDPTFGYTTAGGSYSRMCGYQTSPAVFATRNGSVVSPGSDGTITSISAYTKASNFSGVVTTAHFLNEKDSGGSGIHGEVTIGENDLTYTSATPSWQAINVTNVAVASATVYVLSTTCDPADITSGGNRQVQLAYDLSSGDRYFEDFTSDPYYTNAKEDPWTDTIQTNILSYSIYATYATGSPSSSISSSPSASPSASPSSSQSPSSSESSSISLSPSASPSSSQSPSSSESASESLSPSSSQSPSSSESSSISSSISLSPSSSESASPSSSESSSPSSSQSPSSSESSSISSSPSSSQSPSSSESLSPSSSPSSSESSSESLSPSSSESASESLSPSSSPSSSESSSISSSPSSSQSPSSSESLSPSSSPSSSQSPSSSESLSPSSSPSSSESLSPSSSESSSESASPSSSQSPSSSESSSISSSPSSSQSPSSSESLSISSSPSSSESSSPSQSGSPSPSSSISASPSPPPSPWRVLAHLETNPDDVSGTSNISNFPALIKDGNLPDLVYNNIQADGDDLRFTTDEAGLNQVPFEIVNINTTAKTCEIYVKIPTLSYNTATPIYVWGDNPGASPYSPTDEFGSKNVWSDYQSVLHMNEDPSGSAPQLYCSAENSNVGTSAGTMTSGDLVADATGKAWDFDGTDDECNVTASTSYPQRDLVLSVFAKAETTTDGNATVYIGDGPASNGYGLFLGTSGGLGSPNSPGNIVGLIAGVAWEDSANSYDTTAQHHYAMRIAANGASNIDFYLYEDGTQVLSDTNRSQASSPGTTLQIADETGGYAGFHDGPIGEVRVLISDFGSDWIATESNNMNNPTSFWTSIVSPSSSISASPSSSISASPSASPSSSESASPSSSQSPSSSTSLSPSASPSSSQSPSSSESSSESLSPSLSPSSSESASQSLSPSSSQSPSSSESSSPSSSPSFTGSESSSISLSPSSSESSSPSISISASPSSSESSSISASPSPSPSSSESASPSSSESSSISLSPSPSISLSPSSSISPSPSSSISLSPSSSESLSISLSPSSSVSPSPSPPIWDDKYETRGTSYNDKYSERGTSYNDKYEVKNTVWTNKYRAF